MQTPRYWSGLPKPLVFGVSKIRRQKIYSRLTFIVALAKYENSSSDSILSVVHSAETSDFILITRLITRWNLELQLLCLALLMLNSKSLLHLLTPSFIWCSDNFHLVVPLFVSHNSDSRSSRPHSHQLVVKWTNL